MAFGLAAGLSACGDYLGAYKVENVRLVHTLPQNKTLDWPAHPYSEFLQVELSSNFDLNSANTGPGLYTDADFCPMRNRDRLIALGPIANDELAVESWRRDQPFSPNRADSRYHYLVYVVPSAPPRKLFANSEDQIASYDLRRQAESICLRFFVPGYNVVPSRSDTIEVPAEKIARALRQPSRS